MTLNIIGSVIYIDTTNPPPHAQFPHPRLHLSLHNDISSHINVWACFNKPDPVGWHSRRTLFFTFTRNAQHTLWGLHQHPRTYKLSPNQVLFDAPRLTLGFVARCSTLGFVIPLRLPQTHPGPQATMAWYYVVPCEVASSRVCAWKFYPPPSPELLALGKVNGRTLT